MARNYREPRSADDHSARARFGVPRYSGASAGCQESVSAAHQIW